MDDSTDYPPLQQLPPNIPRPPMRVVTKGWWVWREELIDIEDLRKRRAEEAKMSGFRRFLKYTFNW